MTVEMPVITLVQYNAAAEAAAHPAPDGIIGCCRVRFSVRGQIEADFKATFPEAHLNVMASIYRVNGDDAFARVTAWAIGQPARVLLKSQTYLTAAYAEGLEGGAP